MKGVTPIPLIAILISKPIIYEIPFTQPCTFAFHIKLAGTDS